MVHGVMFFYVIRLIARMVFSVGGLQPRFVSVSVSNRLSVSYLTGVTLWEELDDPGLTLNLVRDSYFYFMYFINSRTADFPLSPLSSFLFPLPSSLTLPPPSSGCKNWKQDRIDNIIKSGSVDDHC